MKKEISKTEALEKINLFFKKDDFSPEEVKKIKKLSMKYKIRLGEFRKQFCKKCLSKLEGKIRIKNGVKNIECEKCGFVNRWKIMPF